MGRSQVFVLGNRMEKSPPPLIAQESRPPPAARKAKELLSAGGGVCESTQACMCIHTHVHDAHTHLCGVDACLSRLAREPLAAL